MNGNICVTHTPLYPPRGNSYSDLLPPWEPHVNGITEAILPVRLISLSITCTHTKMNVQNSVWACMIAHLVLHRRLRQKDLLSPGVSGRSGQHGKTPSLKKKKNSIWANMA
jgi:hypothetical protein